MLVLSNRPLSEVHKQEKVMHVITELEIELMKKGDEITELEIANMELEARIQALEERS